MRKEYKTKNGTIIVEGEPNMDIIKAATVDFMKAVRRDQERKNLDAKK